MQVNFNIAIGSCCVNNFIALAGKSQRQSKPEVKRSLDSMRCFGGSRVLNFGAFLMLGVDLILLRSQTLLF